MDAMVHALRHSRAIASGDAGLQEKSMVRNLCRAAGFALVVLAGQGAQGAEVKLLSSAAFKPALDVLGPQFERATGHKIQVRYELTPAVKQLASGGETFDVVIANPPHLQDLAKEGRVTAGSVAQVARFGVGVGVKAGAAKPDVGTPDALKRALQGAKSVAYVGAGTSGAYVVRLLDGLGIGEEMKAKLKPGDIAASVAAVAKGDIDMVLLPVPLIRANPGIELAGPVPAALQDNITMTAGVGTAAKERDAAQALVGFLMDAEATPVITAKGFVRVTP
jgi:molybdate transport system substrate-binding protein